MASERTVIVFFAGNEVGGAATHLATWAKALKGAQVDYRYRFVSLGDGPLADELRQMGMLHGAVAGTVGAIRDLARVLRRERAWILHSHGPRMNMLASFAASSAGAIWTATIHSHPRYDFEGHPLKAALFPSLHLWRLSRARGLFVVQPALGDALPCRTILEVPNAFFPRLPRASRDVCAAEWRRRLGLNPESRLIGIAARLDPVKQIDVAIAALALLSDLDVHLLVAGDGRDRIRLEAAAEDCGVRHRVHFLGHLQDVRDLYCAIDVHVLPSKSEGAPTSMLEAGYYGAANIGSDVPGIRRMLLDGEAGALVPSGDVQALAHAVRRLLTDTKARDAYVERFQRLVLPRYRPERMVVAYERGYTVIEEDAVRSGWRLPANSEQTR
ncbi:glycosyltransferase family 4 protein [Alicyclobacillus acidocaldarius]|uniref:Glycosyl transferase group 1 n=1 Tax=Alicyclobacillus acidocaldarius subsp. acidocaldarius (strain ATCC 27009 / DSM 446 / BCRC 14685 / JCM 5260 / KCTC 1825 / NBRC 15652 / NCIMB 11725 / NRRL B-14509 / 104-IA) TaxID=521098 RepID=C8WR53_ALIAD|nr:glycosyltransferase family 4 protein [Alicyclobacillus acidocaldarius]ACV59222.1 glycosyl transferase group 1 [Alicyclobacillus acidocaldarius subsp. acidocaldarius DSM 446]